MGGRVQGLGCGVNGYRESLLGLVGERLYDDSAETRLVGVAADAVDEADVTGVGLGLVRVRVVGEPPPRDVLKNCRARPDSSEAFAAQVPHTLRG